MRPALLVSSFIMVLSNPQPQNNLDVIYIKDKISYKFEGGQMHSSRSILRGHKT